jgi:hypothetical protein
MSKGKIKDLKGTPAITERRIKKIISGINSQVKLPPGNKSSASIKTA